MSRSTEGDAGGAPMPPMLHRIMTSPAALQHMVQEDTTTRFYQSAQYGSFLQLAPEVMPPSSTVPGPTKVHANLHSKKRKRSLHLSSRMRVIRWDSNTWGQDPMPHLDAIIDVWDTPEKILIIMRTAFSQPILPVGRPEEVWHNLNPHLAGLCIYRHRPGRLTNLETICNVVKPEFRYESYAGPTCASTGLANCALRHAPPPPFLRKRVGVKLAHVLRKRIPHAGVHICCRLSACGPRSDATGSVPARRPADPSACIRKRFRTGNTLRYGNAGDVRARCQGQSW
jgi:hypothetical protein